jgi:uncharacterized protein with beta-barrel porin domain
MTVAGNLAFQSGAIYLVQLNPTSTTMANVTGTASLNGNVLAAFASGSYFVRQYDILHSAGLGGTTFTSLGTTNLPGALTATLSYDTTDVFLNLTATAGLQAGLNGNQSRVGNALDNFFNGGGMLGPNFQTIFGLSGGNLATALSQLSGEAATGAQQTSFQMMSSFLGLMNDPFVEGRGGSSGGAMGFAPDQEQSFPPDVALAYDSVLKAPPKQPTFDQRWTVWGSGYGGSATTNGDPAAGTNTVTAQTYGAAAGMDYHFTPDTLAGFALAGGGTNWGLAQGLGGGRSDAFQVGGYAKTQAGPGYISAALAFTNYWVTTNRVAPLGDQLQAKFNAQSYGGRVEAGYRFGVPTTLAAFGITPYGALQAQNFHTPGYSETDLTGGGLGLSYNAMDATDTRSELGARFDDVTALGSTPVILRARLAWAHDWFTNPALNATFETLPGASFTVNGASPPKNTALTTVGAEVHVTANWSVIGKFDGDFGSGFQSYAGTGTIKYAW